MDSISQRGSKEVPLLAFIGKTGCMSDSGLQTTTTLSQQKTSIWQKEDISCLSGTGLPRSFQWKHLDESRDESWSNGNAHWRQGSQLHRWPLSPNCVHFNRFYLFFQAKWKILDIITAPHKANATSVHFKLESKENMSSTRPRELQVELSNWKQWQIAFQDIQIVVYLFIWLTNLS